MSRRKVANVLKGVAWLLLAAAVLPTFSTVEGPSGEVTNLTVGLPWSPWLVYRESWSAPTSLEAPAPTFGYETHVEPKCWSAGVFVLGTVLVIASRLVKASGEGICTVGPSFRRSRAAGATCK
ncbi:MAG TPA: hypothetical protein VFI31_25825 [Pirellulales bacterium]|nr:hypothetical protein [Pirellulales bacterium]